MVRRLVCEVWPIVSARVSGQLARLVVSLIVAGCASVIVVAGASAAPALGVADGSVNVCENGTGAISQQISAGTTDNPVWTTNGSGTTTGVPPIDTAADDMAFSATDPDGGSWWGQMNVGLTRLIVPWDIGFVYGYDGADQSYITAHDPGGKWSTYHLEELKNEATCLEWWLKDAWNEGVHPEIDFKADPDYRDGNTTYTDPSGVTGPYQHYDSNEILVPDIDTYRLAIHDFVQRYSCSHPISGRLNNGLNACELPDDPNGPGWGAQVHIIAPMNEPDTDDTGPPGNQLQVSGQVVVPRGRRPGGDVLAGSTPRHIITINNPNCSTRRADYCGPILAAEMWKAVWDECGDGASPISKQPGNRQCVLGNGVPTSGIVAGDFSDASSGGDTRYLQTYAGDLKRLAPVTWAIHPYSDPSNWEWCTAHGTSGVNPGSGSGSFSYSTAATATVAFAHALAMTQPGYGNATSIWLNEISVFGQTTNGTSTGLDFYQHKYGPSGCGASNPTPAYPTGGAKYPTYSSSRQALAFQWLYHTLPAAIPSRDPQVTRIILFRAYGAQSAEGRNLIPGQYSCLYEAIVDRNSLSAGRAPGGGHCPSAPPGEAPGPSS